MPVSPVNELILRPTSEDDLHLEAFDHTKLSAYNTCPTYGVLRYQMHKTTNASSRAMALEAGSALHECFSFIRLLTHYRHMSVDTPLLARQMVQFHGRRLFGDRWSYITEHMHNDDPDTFARNGSLRVLETGGFYDDERDHRRTLTNLEECALGYVDRWNWDHLVWARDRVDPYSDIGVELAFDYTVCLVSNNGPAQPVCRYTGKIDGIRIHSGRPVIEDNKTTGLNFTDAWELQWDTSHQMTGYMAAASLFTGLEVRRAEVLGLRIPLPAVVSSGFMRCIVQRESAQFERWKTWFLTTVEGMTRYKNNPLDTPMFTHSCYRYFRPCIFIPFCVGDDNERLEILDELETQEWSPLHKIGEEA